VEKAVENRAINVEPIGRRPILLVFPHGERVCGLCFSVLRAARLSRRRGLSAIDEAKVGPSPVFLPLF
jgi:hypothetical protein